MIPFLLRIHRFNLTDIRIPVHLFLFCDRIGDQFIVNHRVAVNADRTVLLKYIRFFQGIFKIGAFNDDFAVGFLNLQDFFGIHADDPASVDHPIAGYPDDDQLFQSIKAQASAYLNKDITADELADAIKRTAKGEHPINESFTSRPKVAEQVLHHFRDLPLGQGAETFISPVTSREQEILNYMAKGYLNKQIALALDISEQTVKNHVTSILRKLNANARTQAVVEAIKHGLVSIS